jgi:hypothetical protein
LKKLVCGIIFFLEKGTKRLRLLVFVEWASKHGNPIFGGLLKLWRCVNIHLLGGGVTFFLEVREYLSAFFFPEKLGRCHGKGGKEGREGREADGYSNYIFEKFKNSQKI